MAQLQPQLEHAYAALRASWAGPWKGLPAVVTGSVQWLCGASTAVEAPLHAKRLAVLLACARLVEQAGQSAQATATEPPYHNRLHIADTVVGMAALLQARRLGAPAQLLGQPLAAAEFRCLAAMLLHDYGHDGRVNEWPRQMEQASVDSFEPHVAACGLSPEDWAAVRALILETDPRFVSNVHARAADCAPSSAEAELSFEAMAVLVVEADVLASALEFPGEDLTLSLIQEWAPRYPQRAQQLSVPQGRLGFLRFGARFSSPAAAILGVPEQVERQIASHGPVS
jgi:hypothetical protein